MKILTLHVDYINFKPLKKALKSLADLSEKEKKGQSVKESLVVLTAVEKGDTVKESVKELVKNVKDIKPVVSKTAINLGKLNPLLKDPFVKTIESNGQNQKVVVTGRMGRKNTSINLNKNEINSIIQTFSQTAKIPISEGFFKAAVGDLILSAIVSEQNPRFIIKKIGSY
jgi:hypothetical protein